MKRTVPLTIALVVGIVMIATSYLPTLDEVYKLLRQWTPIIAALAFLLAIVSFTIHHANKIRRKQRQWGFSIASLAAFAAMAIVGLLAKYWPAEFGVWNGQKHESIFMWLFFNGLFPMESTMFSLLAFYMASAAFRAFRIRNLEATLLLVAAILVMIGRVPLGEAAWGGFTDVQQWLMEFPNTAAQRAIFIGVGLGMASTALKIILGIERAYLGKGD